MDVTLWKCPAKQKLVADRTQHLPAARDALLGVLVIRPCIFLYMTRVARMTIRAALNEMLCYVASVMDLALGKLVEQHLFVADRT